MRDQFFQLQKEIAAAKSAPLLTKAPRIEACVERCSALLGAMIERIEALEAHGQVTEER